MLKPHASHGNLLTFTPPGFSQQLNIRFPDSRLAVCAKCKKNFKTRDMCRVRNRHTGPPWTTAYICVTIDPSCLNDKGKFVDSLMSVRMAPWQPFCVKKNFDSDTPVCSACKRTNRTKSFCRERHRHKYLPWCTVHVLLTTLDPLDEHSVAATRLEDNLNESVDQVNDGKHNKRSNLGDEDNIQKKSKTSKSNEKSSYDDATTLDTTETHVSKKTSPKEGANDFAEGSISRNAEDDGTIGSNSDDPGDDINDIADSRTFLAKVSCRSTSVHWLELADDEDGQHIEGVDTHNQQRGQHSLMNPTMLPVPPFGDSTRMNTFHPSAVNYAAQVHQNALKSRQQYFFETQQQQLQQGQIQQHRWPPYTTMFANSMVAPNPNTRNYPSTLTDVISISQSDGNAPHQAYQRSVFASNEHMLHSRPPQQWPAYFPSVAGPPFPMANDSRHVAMENYGTSGVNNQQHDVEDDDTKRKKRPK